MSCFPFMKDISGAKCLLVGGGGVALRKAQKLRPFGVRVAVCAREVHAELAALAEEVYPAYSPEYLQGALFAVAATDDAALNARVAADCRARGVPVNCVDAPALCDFFFPALITAGEVTVAVSTGGASPALAAALREYLEGVLPQNLSSIAERCKALRGTCSPAEYTRRVKAMLAEGV